MYAYLTNDPWTSINNSKKKFKHTHTCILYVYIYMYTYTHRLLRLQVVSVSGPCEGTIHRYLQFLCLAFKNILCRCTKTSTHSNLIYKYNSNNSNNNNNDNKNNNNNIIIIVIIIIIRDHLIHELDANYNMRHCNYDSRSNAGPREHFLV